jgi:hypothetical protein
MINLLGIIYAQVVPADRLCIKQHSPSWPITNLAACQCRIKRIEKEKSCRQILKGL